MSKIQAKECQNVDYKRSWKDEYLKWICGFANAQGATMFFGMDDDLEVHGLKDAKRLLEDIPNKITTTMGLVADIDLQDSSKRGDVVMRRYTTHSRLRNWSSPCSRR
jgi:ATP-dependent DNA helicase RecG